MGGDRSAVAVETGGGGGLTLLVSSWTVPSLGMLYSLSGSFCNHRCQVSAQRQ